MPNSYKIPRGDHLDDCVDLREAVLSESVRPLSSTGDAESGWSTLYTNIVEQGFSQQSVDVDMPTHGVDDTGSKSDDEENKSEHRLRKAAMYFAGALGSAALAFGLFANMGENPKLDAELEARQSIAQGYSEDAQAMREDAPDLITSQEVRWYGTGALGGLAVISYFSFGFLGASELAEEYKARRRKKPF